MASAAPNAASAAHVTATYVASRLPLRTNSRRTGEGRRQEERQSVASLGSGAASRLRDAARGLRAVIPDERDQALRVDRLQQDARHAWTVWPGHRLISRTHRH